VRAFFSLRLWSERKARAATAGGSASASGWRKVAGAACNLPLHASLGVLRGGLSSQEIAHAYFGEQVARMSGISLQFAA
jgi:hypothetical protein